MSKKLAVETEMVRSKRKSDGKAGMGAPDPAEFGLNDPEAILNAMNRDERSLLLYFESCLVNHRGMLEARRMNETDFRIAKEWTARGFVQFQRRPARDIVGSTTVRTHEVHLSEEAWELAHIERRRRAERNQPKGARK